MKHLKLFEDFLNEASQRMEWIFDVYTRDQHGDHVPSSKKQWKWKGTDRSRAYDAAHKKWPRDRYFIELANSKSINEADEVLEGAFHVALFKARNEGAKEFEFKGKIFPVKEKKADKAINEGHSGEAGPMHDVKTKEEAIKKIESWIANSKEEDGHLRKFRGVKWVGATTEDRIDRMASQYEDQYIIAGTVDGEIWMARWSRD